MANWQGPCSHHIGLGGQYELACRTDMLCTAVHKDRRGNILPEGDSQRSFANSNSRSPLAMRRAGAPALSSADTFSANTPMLLPSACLTRTPRVSAPSTAALARALCSLPRQPWAMMHCTSCSSSCWSSTAPQGRLPATMATRSACREGVDGQGQVST